MKNLKLLLINTILLTARACAKEPVIAHGEVQCINGEKVYGNLCEAVCDDGYQVHGIHIVGCDTNGKWGTMPVCKGIRFILFECSPNIKIYSRHY